MPKQLIWMYVIIACVAVIQFTIGFVFNKTHEINEASKFIDGFNYSVVYKNGSFAFKEETQELGFLVFDIVFQIQDTILHKIWSIDFWFACFTLATYSVLRELFYAPAKLNPDKIIKLKIKNVKLVLTCENGVEDFHFEERAYYGMVNSTVIGEKMFVDSEKVMEFREEEETKRVWSLKTTYEDTDETAKEGKPRYTQQLLEGFVNYK